ncbi:hypothetical protein ACGFX2_23945 [Streptomyces goshikiensis]|uniref:hypothetical protein n=1 Tax=Streptomyces goshikiensis TaxID=1942 RepID=UPI003719B447
MRASVVGSAEFVLPYCQDDDVRSFTFDARAVPYSRPLPGIPAGLPTDARTVTHAGLPPRPPAGDAVEDK